MIRVIRFMGANEAIKLLFGESLINKTNHRTAGQSSDSIGFCFSISDAEVDDRTAILIASQYLSGITTMDVCLLAHLDEDQDNQFSRTTAHYAIGDVPELCATRYSLDDFDDWDIYTPQHLPALIQIRSSYNWMDPVWTISKALWRQEK